MAEPERRMPWTALILVASVVFVMLALLAIAGGPKAALVGAIGAILVFSLLLAVVWRAGLLGGRKTVPVSASVVILLFSGMLLVLALAVLVIVLK